MPTKKNPPTKKQKQEKKARYQKTITQRQETGTLS